MTLQVAPGFVDKTELFQHQVKEYGWDVVMDWINLSVALHNAEIADLYSVVIDPVAQVKEKYFLPINTELQPMHGDTDNPKPVGGRVSYDRAYPLFWGGHAWAAGRVVSEKITVAEANQYTVEGLLADVRWIRRRVMAAWFSNVAYTFKDEKWGDLSVGALANGDTQEYVLADGVTATDSHFLFQADAIDSTHDPFPTIETEINEHPENAGDVIAYIPTGLETAVRALPHFKPIIDPDITPGSGTDVVTGAPLIAPLGEKLIGKHDGGVWIAKWRQVPANYILFHSELGGPFVGMRQEDVASLQGLRAEFYVQNGIINVNQLVRAAGFAARNRIAAGAMLIGAGAYAIPTGYQHPIAQ